MRERLIFFLAIGGLALFSGTLVAQTLRARVNLEASHLLPEEQQLLQELPREVQDYVENYEWGDESEEILIECSITFFVQTVTERGSDKIYRGEFLISSPSGENYRDRFVEFPYQRGYFFNHERTYFDPLLDLIDYYVYMVIGGEMDTYELLGGTPYYTQALSIANQGQSSRYGFGWTTRLDQVRQITNADHRPLREAKFYYYDCLYQIEELNNKEAARKDAKMVIDLLEEVHKRQPNSPALKRFLDAHYQEFCKLFVYDENKYNLRRLAIIDDAHRETYQECE
ncbi:MAG: DUF4835 family protein [Calditrichaeota bacterium]|nr:MAG: DUF4835 family protein [Calditrichota bacterium]